MGLSFTDFMTWQKAHILLMGSWLWNTLAKGTTTKTSWRWEGMEQLPPMEDIYVVWKNCTIFLFSLQVLKVFISMFLLCYLTKMWPHIIFLIFGLVKLFIVTYIVMDLFILKNYLSPPKSSPGLSLATGLLDGGHSVTLA